MSEIILGKNQYGKAENRVVRIYRDTPRHEIHDINVSTCLRGDFTAAHLVGDQSEVLPTDTQKQTAYAYAKEKGLLSIEDYGLTLARHFVHDVAPVQAARIEIDEYAWERAIVDGAEHDHTWIRKGQEVRTAAITVDTDGEYVVGGLKDLIVLKSTGSEFAGFLSDPYTVLEPTHDRVMATSLVAQWRFTSTEVDWETVYAQIKTALITQFAVVQSWHYSRRCSTWGAPCWRSTRRSPRCGCRHPTNTTSSTTCPRSGWRTTTRCSTPTTGPTG